MNKSMQPAAAWAVAAVLASVTVGPATACDVTCLALDPLAAARGATTETTFTFGSGTGNNTSAEFILRPRAYLDMTGGQFAFSADLPIATAAAGAVLPPSYPDANGGQRATGTGDLVVRAAYVSEGSLRWTTGLAFTAPTNSKSGLSGPGWGAGVTLGLTGRSGRLTWGGTLEQIWGEDGHQELSVRPVLFYSFENGWYTGYDGVIAYDWSAPEDTNAGLFPAGLSVGRAMPLSSGRVMDFRVGYYALQNGPEGSGDGQLRFGFSLLRGR